MTQAHGEQGDGWQPPTDPAPPSSGRGQARGDGDTPEATIPRFGGRAAVPSQPTHPAQPEPTGIGRASVPPPYAAGRYPDRSHLGPPRTAPPDSYAGTGARTASEAPERPRPVPAARPRRRLTGILGLLAIVALLAVLGAGAYVAFSGSGAGTGTGQQATGHDIGTQVADPTPLTLSEVFPATAVTPRAGQAYHLVKRDSSADCGTAVVGDLGTVLSTAGCTQVLRATLISPDAAYVVTVGLFNVRDEASARTAVDGVQSSVGAGKGRLVSVPAGGPTDVISRAATRLGWDARGHFLAYAVVARADGRAVADDPAARTVIDDLVEKYLVGTVIQARTAPSPSAK